MKNIELTEQDLININGGGRKLNAGKTMLLIEVLDAGLDFISGFAKGFKDVARGK